jgi:hypothetical protein
MVRVLYVHKSKQIIPVQPPKTLIPKSSDQTASDDYQRVLQVLR